MGKYENDTDALMASRVRKAVDELNAAIEAAASLKISVNFGVSCQMDDVGASTVSNLRIERRRNWRDGREAVRL